jgi:hypothetical protein
MLHGPPGVGKTHVIKSLLQTMRREGLGGAVTAAHTGVAGSLTGGGTLCWTFGIAANDVSRSEIGFDSERNELTLLLHDGQVFRSGQATKLACAQWLLATLPLPSPASPESPSP